MRDEEDDDDDSLGAGARGDWSSQCSGVGGAPLPVVGAPLPVLGAGPGEGSR